MRIELPDTRSVGDLTVFVRRARRVDGDGAVRLQTVGGVLVCTVAPLYPVGLEDPTPTVLGVRAARCSPGSEKVDAVVTLGDLGDALSRAERRPTGLVTVEMEASPQFVAWAAVSPPRAGWKAMGMLPAAECRRVVEEGVEEISRGVPDGAGAAAVHRLRALVWGRGAPDFGAGIIPAGAAFALDALGFAGNASNLRMFSSGRWGRLAGPYGDVLARGSVFTMASDARVR